MGMKRLGILAFLFSSMAWVCAAQTARSAAPAEIAIHAGKVLDVRTGNYSSDQTIWIEGDRIKAIGKTSEISSQLPAGTKMIDLANATVLPGLIDCHTHLTMTPYDSGPAGLHASYPPRRWGSRAGTPTIIFWRHNIIGRMTA
jgi:imidazolonepropionase-like amidohydrolase